MPENQLMNAVTDGVKAPQTWTFLQVVMMFVGAALGGTLLSPEPFRLQKFLGEMIFAIMGAVALWHFGLLQSLSPSAVVLLGFSASLGMFRQLTWATRLFRALPIAMKVTRK